MLHARATRSPRQDHPHDLARFGDDGGRDRFGLHGALAEDTVNLCRVGQIFAHPCRDRPEDRDSDIRKRRFERAEALTLEPGQNGAPASVIESEVLTFENEE